MVQTLAVLCTLCIVSLALERPATSSWQSGNSTGLLCSSSWDAAGWVPRTVIKENDLSVVNMESDLFEVGYSLDLASGLTDVLQADKGRDPTCVSSRCIFQVYLQPFGRYTISPKKGATPWMTNFPALERIVYLLVYLLFPEDTL